MHSSLHLALEQWLAACPSHAGLPRAFQLASGLEEVSKGLSLAQLTPGGQGPTKLLNPTTLWIIS